MTRPIPSSHTVLPRVYPNPILASASSQLDVPIPPADWSGRSSATGFSGPGDLSSHPAPQGDLRAPPFPLPPPSDDIKAAAQDDQAASPASIRDQTSTPRIRNPRRTRRFMRWMRKKFTPPWSLVSPHDPSHGKNAAKRADDQGL